MLAKTKLRQKLNKKPFRIILIIVLIVIVMICVWAGIRGSVNISCRSSAALPDSVYPENDRVVNAIALSYLVYGCESCDGLSGTVSELIDNNKMGILTENAGLKRTDSEDPSSALFDTADFVRQAVGDYRFLVDRKDTKSGFYGAAFCDDEGKCVWIAFAGSEFFRDSIACLELVLAPGLSPQEKQAFELYESVAGCDEVQNQGYNIVLTGHSLGGSLATMVACAGGCSAFTVNGADGIAIDKFNAFKGPSYQGDYISNYMTSPEKGGLSFMNTVQRLMFLGDDKAVDCHVYPQNGYTSDPHCAFSFIEFEDDGFGTPTLP